jgi:hypothetical protein
LTYGFAYKLNENGWKGDLDGRIPLLKIKKAIIMQGTFFNEKVYREKYPKDLDHAKAAWHPDKI